MPDRVEQQAFPPDIQTGDERRRWELCAMAAWLAYGYEEDKPLDRWDLQLLHGMTRTYFNSKHDTGDGFITDEQRAMLRDRSVL